MQHCGTRALFTERLVLRRFLKNDAVQMFQNWASDDRVTKYLTWQSHTKVETSAAFLEYLNTQYEKDNFYEWGICLKDGTLIGAIGLSAVDDKTESAQLGYVLGFAYWRQGYMTEAVMEVLRFAFKTLGLRRVSAYHHVDNPASGHVMEKSGMSYEGLIRGYYKDNRGNPCDVKQYSILADDYTALEAIKSGLFDGKFEKHMQLPRLTDGEISLICIQKNKAIPEKDYVPDYRFFIVKDDIPIGELNLRVGMNKIIYYSGHIGYMIYPEYRGNGYAARACKLTKPVCEFHDMKHVLITNDVENQASIRVCQKIGARLLWKPKLPPWHDMYQVGWRQINVFCWDPE